MVAFAIIVGLPLSANAHLATTPTPVLKDANVVAIDQDSLGVQRCLFSRAGNGQQVWVHPLAGGARAVVLFNTGTSAAQITTSASAIGLPAARRYQLFNLWTDETTTIKSTITASVPVNAVMLYRVTAS